MRICIDTSAYSQFKRGHKKAIDTITSAREVYLPAIAMGELRTGFLLGKNSKKNEEELQVFLSYPVVKVLEVDDLCSQIYAEILVELRSAGKPIPTNDIWIAALAAKQGATVITFDQHFESIQRVGSQILS
jgi:predicted nucleic acid-binding protein